MQIWNQWITESHTESHAGSRDPPITKSREDRHIVKSALQYRTIQPHHGPLLKKWTGL